ncbi:MAG: hypothetical protein R2856_26145 [Caldilineaceae bacterium]
MSSDGTQGNPRFSNQKSKRARAVISNDGRYVLFQSDATNLVEDDTNDAMDIFIRDRQARTTERVSVADDGAGNRPRTGPPCPATAASWPSSAPPH